MPDGMPNLTQGESAFAMPSLARKGRGAVSNPSVRFEPARREAFDDGWATLEQSFAALPPLPTSLTEDRAKSALSYNESPDLGFDRSINPYRGCEHGCIYCYARPSHAYLGFSPGLDFETRLMFKPDIAALLEKELRKPGYQPRPIALGANTDPYQPVERQLGLTRAVLEVLDRFSHPVTIVTKSAGVLRDTDILQRLAARNLVRVCLSVTTLDPALARIMEPRAATPARRLQAIRELTAAGVPTAILAAPMIPAVNDMELEKLLEQGAAAGATSAGYVLLRLPLEIKQLFEEWLARHMPDRAARVLSLIRQTRGGALYDSRFGQRQTGSGPYAELLARRFAVAMRRLGLEKRGGGTGALDCSRFAVPGGQMSLF
ncbi:MAG: PA0069 family radical SAM protein [Roseomonas sp.]|nr:PA0069 family radical SAM protein [Roseomonas sp.]